MEEGKDYRQLASDCMAMARIAKNADHRAMLLDIAAKWLDMARQDAETQAVRDQLEAMKRPTS